MPQMTLMTQSAFCGVVLVLLAAAPVGRILAQTPADIAAIDARYRDQAEKNTELHRKGNAVIELRTADDRPVAGASITVDQQTQDFLFGNLVFELTRQDKGPADPRELELHQKRFLEVFNFAVLPFYWNSYEREPGKPRWDHLESAIKWCWTNGVTLKGHPLSWGATVPKWMDRFSPAQQETLLEARILNNTAGFAGTVDIWDVVNEPIHHRPFGSPMGKPYTLSEAAEAIEKALRWAHAGNPNTTLLVNEFDVVSDIWYDDLRPPRVAEAGGGSAKPEGATGPRDTFIRLIQELDKRDVPKYDIGLQTHEPQYDWFKPEDFLNTINAMEKLGHQVHITELTFPSNGKQITGGWRTGTWTREAQADYAEQMYRLAFGHPNVVSINYWGFSDRGVWRDEGGVVDKDYNPKPIYHRLKKLIREQWMTRNLTVKTDTEGNARFRGFYGEYRVAVRASDGVEQSFDLHLSREHDPRWTLRLGAK